MNEFILILLCLFGSIGLVQSIAWLAGLWKKPAAPPTGYHVLSLYNDPAQIEIRLRQELARLRWQGGMSPVVLLADMGLGEECLDVCDRLIQENPGLLRCEAARLGEVIQDLDELQRG